MKQSQNVSFFGAAIIQMRAKIRGNTETHQLLCIHSSELKTHVQRSCEWHHRPCVIVSVSLRM